MTTEERAALLAAIGKQRREIQAHGGDVTAYVQRYGDSRSEPGPVAEGGRYGGGGQVIYHADIAKLHRLEHEYGP